MMTYETTIDLQRKVNIDKKTKMIEKENKHDVCMR